MAKRNFMAAYKSGREKIGRILARSEKMRERGKQLVNQIARSATINGISFAWGFAYAKWGKDKLTVGDVPVNVGIAALLHVGGAFNFAGEASHHMHNVADGLLAPSAFQWGQDLFARLQEKNDTASGMPRRRYRSYGEHEVQGMPAAAPQHVAGVAPFAGVPVGASR